MAQLERSPKRVSGVASLALARPSQQVLPSKATSRHRPRQELGSVLNKVPELEQEIHSKE